jgi:hypothetical protein
MSEYKRPISLIDFQIAIKDSSDKELFNILERLNNSITRLNDSNNLMEKLMNNELTEKDKKNGKIIINSEELDIPTADDINIYIDSINENKLVINNQLQRRKLINDELSFRNLSNNNYNTNNPNNKQLDSSKSPSSINYPSFENNLTPLSTDNDEIVL